MKTSDYKGYQLVDRSHLQCVECVHVGMDGKPNVYKTACCFCTRRNNRMVSDEMCKDNYTKERQ